MVTSIFGYYQGGFSIYGYYQDGNNCFYIIEVGSILDIFGHLEAISLVSVELEVWPYFYFSHDESVKHAI